MNISPTPLKLFIGAVAIIIAVIGIFIFQRTTAPKLQTTPTSVISQEESKFNTYTNTQYGYSIQYPSSLTPKELTSDTYLSFVNFDGLDINQRFSIEIRNSTLEDEIKYQKSKVEGHILAKLTRDEKIIIAKFAGILLEYTPDRADIGPVMLFIIVNNGKYSYTIKGTPQILDKVVPTFKFLGTSQIASPTPMVQIQGQDFEIRGIVTAVSGNTFAVGGRTVTIDPSQVVNFQQKIAPVVGVAVKVEGIVKGNALFAREIQAMDQDNSGRR